MNALLISLIVFAVIFGGALLGVAWMLVASQSGGAVGAVQGVLDPLLGVAVRPLLSESHLQPDSKDVVKMATGLIGTLAALVLGLLIASANSSFDQKTNQVR